MPAVGCVRCGGKGCEDDKSFVWDYNQEAARKFQECHASPPANMFRELEEHRVE